MKRKIIDMELENGKEHVFYLSEWMVYFIVMVCGQLSYRSGCNILNCKYMKIWSKWEMCFTCNELSVS